MTTPKRYEDMARAVVPYDKYLDYEEDNNATWNATIVMPVAEALRNAAREAQVRVLEAAQDLLIFEDKAFRALVTLKERIENGEDL